MYRPHLSFTLLHIRNPHRTRSNCRTRSYTLTASKRRRDVSSSSRFLGVRRSFLLYASQHTAKSSSSTRRRRFCGRFARLGQFLNTHTLGADIQHMLAAYLGRTATEWPHYLRTGGPSQMLLRNRCNLSIVCGRQIATVFFVDRTPPCFIIVDTCWTFIFPFECFTP